MPKLSVQDTCVFRFRGAISCAALIAAFGCGVDADVESNARQLSMPAKVGADANGAAGDMVLADRATPVKPATPTPPAAQDIQIDIRRSLVVTEAPILERFSFKRVMEQLAAQSGVSGVTALSLFQQWWDTQNPRSNPNDPSPHCDDHYDARYGTTLNSYPYLCRPAPSEGAQATCDPFSDESACAYIPIGLFNRFDAAPEDGSHCGEHRVVFAKKSGLYSTRDRNLVIFEAKMMNPIPQQGLKGCRKIADVWADLSKEDDLNKRAEVLEKFYFQGIANLPPVISFAHFGENAQGLGQIRTNQFVETDTGWSMREFKLRKTCAGAACSALFVPVTNKDNAFGGLFEPESEHEQAAAFRAFFPTQVRTLAGDDLASITMAVPDAFNSGQSQSSSATADEMRYLERVGPYPSALRSAIEVELAAIGSSLSVDDILLRAQTISCAGCHRLNNGEDLGGGLTWPSAIGFAHISERDPETVGGVTRFRTSEALNDVFLPLRKAVFEDYLNNKPLPPRGPKVPIGGQRSHG